MRHGRERRSVGTARPTFACSTARWPAAHNRYSCCDQRDFLSASHRLSVASSSTGVSSLGHRVHYFRMWKNSGVWTCLQREIYEEARRKAGRSACPSVVITDGQSVKTTERGRVCGFDGHKRVKGRKRHILVSWLGRNRRLSKDHEYAVQTSETMIDMAAIRIMLNQSTRTGVNLFKHPLSAGAIHHRLSPRLG